MNCNSKWLVSIALCIASLITMGCGAEGYVSVSGTVTHDGKPLENVLVLFTPNADGDNHFPGVFSSGTTDADGKFTLKSKNGDRGAVIGNHSVGFTWADISPMEISFLQEELATVEFEDDPAAAKADVMKRIEATKQKIAGRPNLDPSDNRTFNVPSDGSTEANFELKN